MAAPRSASRDGKWAYNVTLPTPAAAAISVMLASGRRPTHLTAASTIEAMLRSASARRLFVPGACFMSEDDASVIVGALGS